MIERTPRPFVEVGGNRHIIQYVNPAFCRLLGRARDDLVGRSFAEIVPVGDVCLPILHRTFQTGEPFPYDSKVADEPRSAHWLHATWPPLDAGESPVGVIIQLTRPVQAGEMTAINEALLISGLHQHELTADAVKLNELLQQEIKERKGAEAALHIANRRLADQTNELERLVAQRTGKLRETVADLEGFSYSVAHDLRTPLRGMQGFARILLDGYADKFDVEARSYLERITTSAARMDLLIQDVLNYTRVMRSEALITPVDLDKLVWDMVATYPNWQPPKVVIRVDGVLPEVLGHEGFLMQCVSNILSNAIKFVAPGVIPKVRIWAEPRPASTSETRGPNGNGTETGGNELGRDFVRIWFEDNGIGIAELDRSRVFQMFERINPTDQFEGTGIGLTIVRKAVQRLGGRIDFESAVGRGSKFWIELKSAPAPTSTPSDHS